MAIRYVVKRGDSATGIAARYTGNAGRWGELRAINGVRDWNRLRIGETIFLPSSWAAPAAPGIGGIGGLSLSEARTKTFWISDDFIARFAAICERLRIPTLWGMALLFYESGVQPWRQNPYTRATGLMQWMPEFAPLPVEQMARMTAMEQLPYVDAWWTREARKRGGAPFSTPGLVYAIVAAPGVLSPTANESTGAYYRPAPGKPGHNRPPPSEIGRWKYWANESWDTNRDGVIDVGDFSRVLQGVIASSEFAAFATRVQALGGPPAPPFPSSGGGSTSPSSGGLVASSSSSSAGLVVAAQAAAVTVAAVWVAYLAVQRWAPEWYADRFPRGVIHG